MKQAILNLVLQLLLQLISSIIDKAEENDKAVQKEREKTKDDVALAQKIREAYPSMSDSNIIKQLC